MGSNTKLQQGLVCVPLHVYKPRDSMMKQPNVTAQISMLNG